MKIKTKILLGSLVILIIGVIVYIYAMFFGAKLLKVKEYKIESNKISNAYDGLKVIHISDIHYDVSITKEDLKNIIKNINALKPDLVFLTGDLVDDKITQKQHNEIADAFKELNAKIGKYAILGNHDYSYKNWNELITDMGFTNLNDSYELIYDNSNEAIFIAGISSNIYAKKGIEDRSETIFEYLNSANTNQYKILLMHEPDYIEDIDYNKFDLILSGHSHNGQVRFPLIGALYTPVGSKKYYKEYYRLNETDLYISSGLGTTLLPIRLFNRPSFNLYRIVEKK